MLDPVQSVALESSIHQDPKVFLSHRQTKHMFRLPLGQYRHQLLNRIDYDQRAFYQPSSLKQTTQLLCSEDYLKSCASMRIGESIARCHKAFFQSVVSPTFDQLNI